MGCKTSKCVEYRIDGTEHTFQLHTAIQQCNYEEARHLILNGTNVNCINYIGATPLIETCRTSRLLGKQRERESFVRFLIMNGAQVDMNDITGGTAMSYATENGLNSIVNMLKQGTRGTCRGESREPLHRCSEVHRNDDKGTGETFQLNAWMQNKVKK